MSERGDSTRDWLLKKLLKAKESLIEQARDIGVLTRNLKDAHSTIANQRLDAQNAADALSRLAERVDDLEFENQQLKRVPPIAPNLEVLIPNWKDSGLAYKVEVLSVASSNGKTKIEIQLPRR